MDGSTLAASALDYGREDYPDATVTVVTALETGGGDLSAFAAMRGEHTDEHPTDERAIEILAEARDRTEAADHDVRTIRARG